MPGTIHYLAQTEGNSEESQVSGVSVSKEFQGEYPPYKLEV